MFVAGALNDLTSIFNPNVFGAAILAFHVVANIPLSHRDHKYFKILDLENLQ